MAGTFTSGSSVVEQVELPEQVEQQTAPAPDNAAAGSGAAEPAPAPAPE